MKRITLIGIPLVVLVTGGLAFQFLYVPAANESHHTNREYIRWKKGKTTYNPSVALRFLNADADFRLSLRGKTKPEVANWFPDLRSPTEANDYQQYYNQEINDVDFLWIGDSAWGIEFQNGVVKEFRLLKG
ncbi:MAG: hypothetical protein WD708_10885 [Kiritimatiellia bacterium]